MKLNKYKYHIYILLVFSLVVFILFKFNYNCRKNVIYIINQLIYTNTNYHHYTISNLLVIKQLINKYYITTKKYPTSMDDIISFHHLKNMGKDYWHNYYNLNSKLKIIYSSGPDWESNYEYINDPSNQDDIKMSYVD